MTQTEHPSVLTSDWDSEPHTHCRCGRRLLPMLPPWQGPKCAGCGGIPDWCNCRDGCCESCGWGPT